MKKSMKRAVVASLLILLASLFACAGDMGIGSKPVAALPPEPTLIAIRDAGSPSYADKTPTPYKAKKKAPKKAKATAPKSEAAPAKQTGQSGETRSPDCPKCPEQSADNSNAVLDALAKELSLALDVNKAVEDQSAPKKE